MNTHRNVFTVARIRALLGFLVLLLVAHAVACDDGHQGQERSAVEDGQAMLSVGTIPENVSCVIVTVTGEFRSVEQGFDVLPGDTLSQALTGLPVGSVVFAANAYAKACADVSKSTSPMWISEDKTVNLVQGKNSSVTLTLIKNGRAKVTVEFADQEDGGTRAGANRDGSTD
jgi:hypothetical protein